MKIKHTCNLCGSEIEVHKAMTKNNGNYYYFVCTGCSIDTPIDVQDIKGLLM